MNKSVLTGTAGEEFAKELLEKSGGVVFMSTDKFDMEKDLTVKFGEFEFKVEVKAQAPLMKHGAFSFSANQLRKLQGVDFTILIGLKPSKEWEGMIKMESPIVGGVFQLRPDFKYTPWRDSQGNGKFMIPVRQDAVKLVHRLSDEELDRLSENTFKAY